MMRCFIISCSFLILLCLDVTAYATGTWDTGYLINNGTTNQRIITDAAGTEKCVTNNSGSDVFVPTKTCAEWDAFVDSLPDGVTVSDVKTCGSLGYSCGTYSDGCGGTINCGFCGACLTCSGGVCQPVPDGTDCDFKRVCRKGACVTNYIVVPISAQGTCNSVCSSQGGRICRGVGSNSAGTNNRFDRFQVGEAGPCVTIKADCGTSSPYQPISCGTNYCRCSYYP